MTRAELVAAVHEAVLARDGRPERDEIRFRCPAHDDERPSARWHPTRHVWHCDACGAGAGYVDLARRLGLLGDRAPRETVYRLRDGDGTVVAEHVRQDFGGGRKRMWWRRPDGRPKLGGRRTRDLPLYGVDRLSSADSAASVVVVEGERAAEALLGRGTVAVGTVTGASGTPCDDTLRALADRDVVLWPDADPPGREHMQRIAVRLAELKIAARWYDAATDAQDGRDAVDCTLSDGELRAALAAAPAWRASS